MPARPKKNRDMGRKLNKVIYHSLFCGQRALPFQKHLNYSIILSDKTMPYNYRLWQAKENVFAQGCLYSQ